MGWKLVVINYPEFGIIPHTNKEITTEQLIHGRYTFKTGTIFRLIVRLIYLSWFFHSVKVSASTNSVYKSCFSNLFVIIED